MDLSPGGGAARGPNAGLIPSVAMRSELMSIALPLPAGLRQRTVRGVNGLDMHLLEAGQAGKPCLLMLHSFPELTCSWRKLMPVLADAGYHVIAPDQRGDTAAPPAGTSATTPCCPNSAC